MLLKDLPCQDYPNNVFVYKVGQCIKLASGVCVCTVLAVCVKLTSLTARVLCVLKLWYM